MGIKAITKDFLVSFRNYCFNETKNSRDEAYAEGAHLQLFMIIIFVYLFSVPASLMIVVFRIIPGLLQLFKAYPIMRPVYAVLVLVLVGRMVLQVTRKVATVPVDTNWGKEKLSQLRAIYIFFMVFSLLALFGSMFLTSKIVFMLGL